MVLVSGLCSRWYGNFLTRMFCSIHFNRLSLSRAIEYSLSGKEPCHHQACSIGALGILPMVYYTGMIRPERGSFSRFRQYRIQMDGNLKREDGS